MKKTNMIYLILFILAAGFAAWLLLKKKETGTVPQDAYHFAVEDTASITKIIITDHNGHKALLTRIPSGWRINNKYIAAPERMNLLLETIKLVSFKEFVPAKAKRNVINDMAASSMKVEIWKGEGESTPFKSYFVGGMTHDELGTYMYMADSKEPVVTSIQGFDGYLTGRYFTEENEWRSKKLFPYSASEIQKMTLIWYNKTGNLHGEDTQRENKEDGWQIISANNSFTLRSLASSTPEQVDGVLAKPLLISASDLYFENFVSDGAPGFTDSILKEKPFALLGINKDNATWVDLNLIRKRADHTTKGVDKNGWDLDHLYGFLSSNPKELLLLQWPQMQPLLKKCSELKP